MVGSEKPLKLMPFSPALAHIEHRGWVSSLSLREISFQYNAGQFISPALNLRYVFQQGYKWTAGEARDCILQRTLQRDSILAPHVKLWALLTWLFTQECLCIPKYISTQNCFQSFVDKKKKRKRKKKGRFACYSLSRIYCLVFSDEHFTAVTCWAASGGG